MPDHNPNRDRPLRVGYLLAPNRLWTLDELTYKQRCLLGWLHSHADNYLERLSLRRIGREFGGERRTEKDVHALAERGWCNVAPGGAGFDARVILKSGPWERLLSTGADKTTAPSTMNGSEVRPKSPQGCGQNDRTEKNTLEPDAVSSENMFTVEALVRAAEKIRNDPGNSLPRQQIINRPKALRLTQLDPQPPIELCALALLGEEQSLIRWNADNPLPTHDPLDQPMPESGAAGMAILEAARQS